MTSSAILLKKPEKNFALLKRTCSKSYSVSFLLINTDCFPFFRHRACPAAPSVPPPRTSVLFWLSGGRYGCTAYRKCTDCSLFSMALLWKWRLRGTPLRTDRTPGRRQKPPARYRRHGAPDRVPSPAPGDSKGSRTLSFPEYVSQIPTAPRSPAGRDVPCRTGA